MEPLSRFDCILQEAALTKLQFGVGGEEGDVKEWLAEKEDEMVMR